MSKDNGYTLTGEGRFEVAPKNNTLLFVFDSSESAYFNEVLEMFPDVYDAFSGFTYYPNSISVYSRTYPSVIYMLTGEKCYFDKPPAEYIQEAYERGTMLKDLNEAGIDNRKFGTASYLSNAVKEYVSNIRED